MAINLEFFKRKEVIAVGVSFFGLLLVGNLFLTLMILKRGGPQATPSPTTKRGFLMSPTPRPTQPVVPTPTTTPTPLPPIIQTPVPRPTPVRTPPTVPGWLINPLTGKPLVATIGLDTLIQTLVSLLIMGSVFLAFIFLIIGGVKFILSGGDEKKSDEAKKVIVNSLIGLGVVILSYIILTFIGGVLGIDIVALIDLLAPQ